MEEASFGLDQDLICTYWSKGFEKAKGIPAADALGKPLSELFPAGVALAKMEAVCREVLRSQQPRVDIIQYRLHGREAVFETSAYPLKTGLFVFARDIGGGGSAVRDDGLHFPLVIAYHTSSELDNLRLLEQVKAGRARLNRLAKELIDAQEVERQRLAGELHDDLGQSLVALKISLELLLADLPRTAKPLRQRLAQSVAMTGDLIQLGRTLAYDLYPPALHIAGLNLAMEQLCRDLAERAHLEIKYCGQELPGLPDATALALYRCLQEALTNVMKHAGAAQVRVVLRAEGDAVRLEVSDDGRGFDPEAILAEGHSRGLGLRLLRERANLLGGQLEIESATGQGCRLVALAPLRQNHLERRTADAARSNR
ncbi:MAG: sensor histidine kinase [Chloroflexota bacterium]